MEQPLDREAAALHARLVFLTAQLLTETTKRPDWNRGEFF
jgi:hypothetical protein